jgi:hypothetical protein
MNRKPIFDAVRAMLGRGFKAGEVQALDHACDLAEAATAGGGGDVRSASAALAASAVAAAGAVAGAAAGAAANAIAYRLGKLSEVFESGGRGPGTVSPGSNDPGGVSYGMYQLSSKAGTLSAFLRAEGKGWAGELSGTKPGSAAFSERWKKIAAREPDAFREAQHRFIERSHYRKAVADVLARKGIDLDRRHNAVRDAVWSVAVQHGKAADILVRAVDMTDPHESRGDPGYDRRLAQAIYDARTDYVLRVANNPKLSAGERAQLIGITKNRYPKECADCLHMLDQAGHAPPAPPAPLDADGDTIDGNKVAAAHGVLVKSAAVKIARLHPAMAPAIAAVAAAVKTLGLPRAVITSGNDSKHMTGSLHFQNRALDFRGNNIAVSVGDAFAREVKATLGEGYDVLFETFLQPANNHLHVEYDPR